MKEYTEKQKSEGKKFKGKKPVMPDSVTRVMRHPERYVEFLIKENPNDGLFKNLQARVATEFSGFKDSKLLPGGSATEMACAHAIRQVILSHGPGEERKEQFEFDGVVYEESVLSIMEAVAQALESIAKVLIENTGKNTMRTMTLLRAQHSLGNFCTGINGETGELLDMNESTGIWEPYCVKTQTIKTSIESASMLLRIDDIVSGITPSQG